MASIPQPSPVPFPLSTSRAASPNPQSMRIRPPLAFSTPAKPRQLALCIDGDPQAALHFECISQIAVGRADWVEGYVPGVDLSPFGAVNAGVSRRHALLYIADGEVCVRDLNSTNGTRVNSQRLQPDQSCQLADGDVIDFAQFRVVIRFL